MKYIFFASILLTVSSFAQQKSKSTEEIQIYKNYNLYKKELYIDNLLKEKIPTILNHNYYKNLLPTSYKEGMLQRLDTIKKIQRIFIYTQKSNTGFLRLNSEISNFMKVLPDSVNFVYVKDNDTIKNFNQVMKLISLKDEDILNLKYKKLKQDFIIDIITHQPDSIQIVNTK